MKPPSLSRLRRPLAFVFVEGITSIGISTTIFAVDVWVFQRTGSYTVFALIAMLAAVPGVVLSPFSGPLIDRWPRGRLLLTCAATGALVAGVAAGIAAAGAFDVPVAAAAVILLAVLQTLRLPAIMATVSMVTEADDIERISAMEESIEAGVTIASPLCGVWLLHHLGLAPLLAVATLSFAGSALLPLALSLPLRTAQRGSGAATRPHLIRELADGARWLWQRKRLRRLLLFVAILNIGATTFVTVQSPRVLLYVDATALAQILGTGGLGLLCGGIAVSITGGIRPHARAIYFGAAGIALGIFVSALSTGRFGLACGAFLFGFLHPFVNTAMQVIWRTETPVSLQGRVFSLRRMVVSGLGPLAIGLSIPLSQAVFEPALERLRSDWPAAASRLGEGQAGALGLMLAFYAVAMGLLVALFQHRRFLETDATADALDGRTSIEQV